MIHIQACQRKWLMVEEAKPNKRERRPLPPPPPQLQSGMPLPTNPREMDEFNSHMYAYW